MHHVLDMMHIQSSIIANTSARNVNNKYFNISIFFIIRLIMLNILNKKIFILYFREIINYLFLIIVLKTYVQNDTTALIFDQKK
jgi:hypothetical protein